MAGLRDLLIQAATQEDRNGWGDILAEKSAAKQKQQYELDQLAEKEASDTRGKEENLKMLLGLGPKQRLAITGVGSNYNPEDGIRAQQMQNLEQERERKALQDIADRSKGAGTANSVPALQRTEKAIPGLYTSENNIKFKSVGGAKNLIPDIAVPIAEKIGMLDEGADLERSAINEILNTKIYDSTGKAMTIPESDRIKLATGLRGIFGDANLVEAFRQHAASVFSKQQNVGAGSQPKDLETFKKQKGLAGYGSIKELVEQAPTGIEMGAMIPVIGPNGKKGRIPEANLQKALQKGFKRVQ